MNVTSKNNGSISQLNNDPSSSSADDSCSNTSANLPSLTTSSKTYNKEDVESTSDESISEEIDENASSESGELLSLPADGLSSKTQPDDETADKENNKANDNSQEGRSEDGDSETSKSSETDGRADETQNSTLNLERNLNKTVPLKDQETESCKSDSETKPLQPVEIQIRTVLTDKIPIESASQKSEKIQSTNGTQYNYLDDPTMPGVEAIHCPKGIMHDLAETGFDVWRLDRDSMVDHIEYMYHDLEVVRAWKIPRTTLRMFLLGIRERYQDNPYHNFKHCFCVTQMAYSILCKLRLTRRVSVDHMGALLTAAVCHDVDHPGLNNSYHCHARTPLAILYNYQSILEQHHFAVTCRILSNKERNIFRNVNNRDEVLTNVGELILATDLARHKGLMEQYSNYVQSGFDFKNSMHVMALLKIIIKCADVSNEVRPETVAGPWVERLFAEYYEQSAREKRECLPVTSYMDPDMVNISESQEGFIKGMMLPMFDELSKLVEEARDYYMNPLYETLLRYEIQNIRDTEA